MNLNLNRMSRGTIAAFAVVIALLAPVVALGMWWSVFDEIAPRIVPEEAAITDLSPNAKPGQNRWFEVVRVINADSAAPCTIHSFLERLPPGGGLYGDRQVIQDPATYAIATANTTVEKGRHRRDRFWAIPGDLPRGEYQYRSFMRFCNPFRCKDVWFDPLPVQWRSSEWSGPQ